MQARLLIINPNTSASVSELLRDLAQREIDASGLPCEVRVRTAGFGARYISDELSFAIAGHALLDAYAQDAAEFPTAAPSAVLIGCFGDPGLLALRALCPLPVLGLAQASIEAAHATGPYAILTGGQAWVPMLQRLVTQIGCADGLTTIQAVEKTGAQLAGDPQAAVRDLAEQCQQIARTQPDTQSILLGGAALGGLSEPLSAALRQQSLGHLTLMDSVQAALSAGIRRALRQTEVPSDSAANAPRIESLGLSPALTRLLNPSQSAKAA